MNTESLKGRAISSPDELDAKYFMESKNRPTCRFLKCRYVWDSSSIPPDDVTFKGVAFVGIRAKALALFLFFTTFSPVYETLDADGKPILIDEKTETGIKDIEAQFEDTRGTWAKKRSAVGLVRRVREMFPDDACVKRRGGTIDHVESLFRYTRTLGPLTDVQVERILELTARYVAHDLGVQADSILAVLERDWYLPSEIYMALAELKLDRDVMTVLDVSLRSQIGPAFQGSPHVGNTEVKTILRDMERAFLDVDNPMRALVLHGEPYSGKTSLLVSLMHRLSIEPRIRENAAESDYFICPNTHHALPVFALNTRHVTFRDFLGKILDFLAPGDHEDQSENWSNEDLLVRIKSLASRRPALYVLTNVGMSVKEDKRNPSRSSDFFTAFDMLCSANDKTRLILSSLEPLGRPLSNMLESGGELANKDFRLPEQSLEQLSAFGPIERRLDIRGRFRPGDEKIKTSGKLLTLLASTAGISGDKDWVDPVFEDLRRGASYGTAPENRPDRDEAEARVEATCWDTIIKARGWRSFETWALLLTSLSEDGLSEQTAREFERHLSSAGFIDSHAKPLQAVDALIDQTDRHLIYRVSDSASAYYEKTPEEKLAPKSEGQAALRYVVDETIAKSLVSNFHRLAPDNYRLACALIAFRARERAHMTKLQIKAIYGTERYHYARDIQVFHNLMSSIDPSQIQASKTSSCGISCLYEDKVFSFPPSEIAPINVLRYGYFRILRKDIDRSNRLTMILDDDRVRLQLYLQLFNIGEPFQSHTNGQPSLPDRIPDYLRLAFEEREIAKILVSVGISAFFSSKFSVLNQACCLAKALVHESSNSPALVPTLTRLWCTELDMLYLKCGEYQSGVTAWEPMRDRIESLKGHCKTIKPKISRKLALQRVRFHEIRLDSKERPFSDRPVTAVKEAIKISDELNNNLPGSSGAMSGRNVRILLKALIGEPVFHWGRAGEAGDATWDEHLKLARSLLAYNLARLSRYSGGDRVAVLIDAAMIVLAEGRFDRAYDYINQANDSIFYSQLSASLRLDLLWHHGSILYYIAIKSGDKNRETLNVTKESLLNEAETQADRLEALGGGEFPLFRALAEILKAKIKEAQGYPVPPDASRNAYATFTDLNAKVYPRPSD